MATITSNSGNVNVSFFPTNVNPVWFCDKNTGGINIAANGAPVASNTVYIGNTNTTTNVSGKLSAALINTSTPSSSDNSTLVPTTAWVTSNFAKSVGPVSTDAISGTNWNVSNLNVSILRTAVPLSTENSTVVPTTSWVTTGYGAKSGGNTWSGVNTFGNLSTTQSLTSSDSTSAVPPTSWVTSNFGRLSFGNTWSGTNAFGTITTNNNLGSGDSTTAVPPSSWVASNFGRLSFGNTWSGTNTFGMIASNQMILPSDSSTTVATTAWTTNNFPKLSANNTWTGINTWTGTNSFGTLTTGQTLASTDSSTSVATTSWVTSFFPKLSGANSWSNTNYFNQGLQTYASLPASESSANVPSSSWVTTNFAKLSGTNIWSGINTFGTLNTSQVIGATESSQMVATTNWVTTNFAKIGSTGGSSGSSGSTGNSSTVNASTLNVSTRAMFDCPINTNYNPLTIGQGQIGHIVYGTFTSPYTVNSINLPSGTTQFASISLYKGVWFIYAKASFTTSNLGYNALTVLSKDTYTSYINTVPLSNGMNTSTPGWAQYNSINTYNTVWMEIKDYFVEETTNTYKWYMQYSGSSTIFGPETLLKAVRIA
jgi:hypothetical protein